MDRSEIRKLANLARLHIDDDALDEVATSITNVLRLVDQLQVVDISNVEFMAHPLDSVQRLRADVVTESNERDVFQAIAPATEDGLYLVPKVID